MSLEQQTGGKDRRRYHIGMRNIKTTASVLCCLIIYLLIGREDSLLAVTSAIICMQNSVELSVYAGITRLAGTGIGALWGMVLRVLLVRFPAVGLNVLIASVGVMLLIMLCVRIRQPDSIVMACIVFLAILLGESGDNPFVYSINRMLDTFIGIAVAIVINRFLRKPAFVSHLQEGRGEEQAAETPERAEHKDLNTTNTNKQ